MRFVSGDYDDPAPPIDHVEMDLLREFYVAWVSLHKIPRDPLHRRKQETAAQKLVDCGHALRIFYQGNEYRDPLKPRIALDG